MLPTLAGGTPLEGGSGVQGAVTGLTLGSSSADVIRACLEGIAFALDRCLQLMRAHTGSDRELLISGGGTRSALWNRIYADVLDTPLVRTSVGQQAASLGAAACAFVGMGVWSDYSRTDDAHTVVERISPSSDATAYSSARVRFARAAATLASISSPPPTPSELESS